MVVPGKMRRRGKYSGYRSDWKKAYVTLREGEKMIEYGENFNGNQDFQTKDPLASLQDGHRLQAGLTTDEPYKPLLEPKNRINGRNNYGQLRSSSRRRKQEALSRHRFPRDKIGFLRRSKRSNTIRTVPRSSLC
jgi:hypothetical protein